MFTKIASNDFFRSTRRARIAIYVLALGGALGLVTLASAKYTGPHRPPCRAGEVLNHRTGMCILYTDPGCIEGRTARIGCGG